MALAVPHHPVGRTVVAVPQPTVVANGRRVRLGQICKLNCTLEGCAHVPCMFEHVKGVRALTAAEKVRVKAMIAEHNLKVPTTGFPMITADPAVVD